MTEPNLFGLSEQSKKCLCCQGPSDQLTNRSREFARMVRRGNIVYLSSFDEIRLENSLCTGFNHRSYVETDDLENTFTAILGRCLLFCEGMNSDRLFPIESWLEVISGQHD